MNIAEIIIFGQPVMILILLCVAVWQHIRLQRTEQRIQNVEVEAFYPMAEAAGPDGEVKKRVTLCGTVYTLVSIAKAQNQPKAGQKIIHTPGAGKVIFTPNGAIRVDPKEGPAADVGLHPGTAKPAPKLELAK